MPRTIRFHLDENCPAAIAEGLRRRGIDITTTPDAGLLTASDEEQTAYALAEGRVIFTLDKDFLRMNAREHCASIQSASRQSATSCSNAAWATSTDWLSVLRNAWS